MVFGMRNKVVSYPDLQINGNTIERVTQFNFLGLIVHESLCSLAVSILDSPAVDPRSNLGSRKILMSENLRLYTTSPVVMC